MQGIRTVLIDVDNTLLDFNRCAEASLRAGFFARGLPWSEAVFPTFTAVNDRLWEALERGELDRDTLHGIRFGIVLEELGLTGDGRALEAAFVGNLAESHDPVDGAMALLSYLAPKFRQRIRSWSNACC